MLYFLLKMQSVISQHLVLDGGVSTEIAYTLGHSYIDQDPLWSASLLVKQADEVLREVHDRFLRAGSDVIETVTYQASVQGFTKHAGVSEEQAFEFIKKGAEIAVTTRNEFWLKSRDSAQQSKRPFVAGSIGPYGAFLADGSEYHGRYIDDIEHKTLKNYYVPSIRALTQGGVDMLAFDTIPSPAEADVIIDILQQESVSLPVWISFQCKDGKHVGHGEPFADASMSVLKSNNVFGVGINCTHPKHVTSLLQSIPEEVKVKKTVIVYPNKGDDWDANNKCWLPGHNERTLVDYVSEWVTSGASWIGGCCRVTAEDMKLIRAKLMSLPDHTS